MLIGRASARRSDRRARRASSSARRTACRAAPSRGRAGVGTSRPTSGPMIPPATMPIDGLETSATPTATPAPTMAATSSRRPVISPTARPIIAAGKMTSMPSRAGSGICAPRTTPASVARFHGMNVAPIAADPVAALVGPADPPEVADRQRERLVGQEVGHHRPTGERHVAQPRPQRRRIEQVARVEQRGQQDDPGPRPGRSPRSRRPRTGRRPRRRWCSSPSPRSARSRPPARPGRRRTRTRGPRRRCPPSRPAAGGGWLGARSSSVTSAGYGAPRPVVGRRAALSAGTSCRRSRRRPRRRRASRAA